MLDCLRLAINFKIYRKSCACCFVLKFSRTKF
nr:MAG TPA: hypothetical protein [Bacteriophage sp.]